MVFAGAVIIGLVLGLLGSGGTIITIPILIYGMGFDPKDAVTAALLIVGAITLVQTLFNAASGQLQYSLLVSFGIPGLTGAILGARLGYLLPSNIQLQLFAFVMLSVGIKLLFVPGQSQSQSQETSSDALILHRVLAGFITGLVTGCVGIGGGFLIVPALILFTGVSFSVAVPISLMFITINSLAGFFTYMVQMAKTQPLAEVLPWGTIGTVILIGLGGSFVGRKASRLLSQTTQSSILSGLLLLMALVTLFNTI
ncbi:sulfite exporter TauE/SafE family protein [Shewanella corallii]|uniref:Probable membrane transporter protein n=1 Tax=Shewanella corallii TaxID=560080 RepID=A0ABT0N4T7_9GAMM|nr:sulfite exporter TauE/SafE family protein [Shewanella corallii]MCL2913473.1 sulfite exporter TauE/SafE family protein [Shewanella corallii]